MERRIEDMTRYEILDVLCEDGFGVANAAEVSRAIQRAARAGTLLWTRKHIIATGPQRIRTIAGRIVEIE